MTRPTRSSLPRQAVLAAASFLSVPHAGGADSPVPIPVVTTREAGGGRGDTPGKLQLWVQRQDPSRDIIASAVDHRLPTNAKGLLGGTISGLERRPASR